MYKITEKDKIIELVEIAEHRQLHPKEIRVIYNTILRILNTNCEVETVENLKRVLFVLENYHDIKKSQQLLLISLHICKLDHANNAYNSSKIDNCLNMVGDFKVTYELKHIWNNIVFISCKYLNKTNSVIITNDVLDLIKLSTTSYLFETTPFYLLLYSNFTKSQDITALNKLNKLVGLFRDEFAAINYIAFIKWVLT